MSDQGNGAGTGITSPGEPDGAAGIGEPGSAVDLTIPGRFAGPPGIGHGGYVAGHFAAVGTALGGPVQVTLRRPTPLDTPLRLVTTAQTRVELRQGDDVCAVGESGVLDLEPPTPPGVDEAAAAEEGSPSRYNTSGVHPTCFGCSIVRAPGDGLRIAAGPVRVDGHELVAAAWTPEATLAARDGQVDPRHVVAALDCPGAFAFLVDGDQPGLLGRITYELRAPVVAGEPHVVTGWRIGRDGRKLFAGTAVHAADGTVCAVAQETWFVVDWSQVIAGDGGDGGGDTAAGGAQR